MCTFPHLIRESLSRTALNRGPCPTPDAPPSPRLKFLPLSRVLGAHLQGWAHSSVCACAQLTPPDWGGYTLRHRGALSGRRCGCRKLSCGKSAALVREYWGPTGLVLEAWREVASSAMRARVTEGLRIHSSGSHSSHFASDCFSPGSSG